MWKNSRTGVKTIVCLFAFVLLASPCFAQAGWVGLFGKTATPSLADVVLDSAKESLEQFSQELSTSPSLMPSEDNLTALNEQLNALEKAYTESQNLIANLLIWSENLEEQLKTYVETEKISEEEYNQIAGALGFVAGRSDDLEEKLIAQNAEIEKLKKKAGTKAYGKVNALFGFKDSNPYWSAGLALGTKFGNGLMIECGANYMIGDMSNPIQMPTWDIDKLTFTASIGWTF